MEQVLIVDQWWSREEKAVSPDRTEKLLEQKSQLIAEKQNRYSEIYCVIQGNYSERNDDKKDGTAPSTIQNKRGMVAKCA